MFDFLKFLWSSIPIIMSIITVIALFRLSEPRSDHYKIANYILNFGTYNVIITIILWVYLYIKTRDLERTIGLSRDRWHTIYPRTVIAIVFSIFSSYTLMCIGTYFIYNFSGVIIVTLIFIMVYHTIKKVL